MRKNSFIKLLLSFVLIVSVLGGIKTEEVLAAQAFIYPATGSIPTGGYFGDDRSHGDHNGLDISNNYANSPIIASASGTVITSGWDTNYGEWILLRHNLGGQTYETVYAHLTSGSRKVSVGEQVNQGQLIGYMGSTGDSTGQHLHFEIHVGTWNTSRSNAVDPKPYLDGLINPAPSYHQFDNTWATLTTKSNTGDLTVNFYSNPGYGLIGTKNINTSYKVYLKALASDGVAYYGIGGGYIHEGNAIIKNYQGTVKSGVTVQVYDAPNGNPKKVISAGTSYKLIASREVNNVGWYAVDSTNWFKASDLNVIK